MKELFSTELFSLLRFISFVRWLPEISIEFQLVCDSWPFVLLQRHFVFENCYFFAQCWPQGVGPLRVALDTHQ